MSSDIPKQYNTIQEWASAMADGREKVSADDAKVLAKYLDDAALAKAIETVKDMDVLDALEAEYDGRRNGKVCQSCRM